MDELNEIETACFQIIAFVGTAKSHFIEAMRAAGMGAFEEADSLMLQGAEEFQKGHDIHFGLLRREASGGDKVPFSFILMHAEDQMMSAETIQVMAQNNIDMLRARTV